MALIAMHMVMGVHFFPAQGTDVEDPQNDQHHAYSPSRKASTVGETHQQPGHDHQPEKYSIFSLLVGLIHGVDGNH